MASIPRSPSWQRALVILSGIAVAVVLTAAVYWAQRVLIPVALAVFLAFLLSPLVTRLQHHGLGRVPSVLLVVLGVLLIVGSLGWLISAQIQGLAASMPQYTENIKERVRTLRDLGKDSTLEQLNQMAKEIGDIWSPPPPQATKVELETAPSWFGNLLPTVPWLMEILASGALALVLAVFMLLKREDLRNRVIWLTGRGRVALTTKALDDIGHRISRYLVAQLLINGSYGVAMALGLALIGIEHWLLWGFLAGLMRYLPYIGAPVAAIFPLTLSIAQFPGWTEPLLVVGLLISLELLAANVLEPLLFGKSIGVSEVALLVSAGFWTFLWGPAGLVLSGPLTVCLIVVGEYVPPLRFLAVLLGDEPALEPDVSLFQRLAAGDQDEAMAIVTQYAKEHSPEQIYDGLLVPALSHVRRALDEGALSDQDEQFIQDATRMILDEYAAQESVPPALAADSHTETAEGAEARAGGFQAVRNDVRSKVRVVCCAAHDELDEMSLVMLKQLIDPARVEVEVVPVTLLAGELISAIAKEPPAALCIGGLPPGGLAHTRYLCKRLRARFADLKIIAGHWSPSLAEGAPEALRRAAGADKVHHTLLAARDQVMAWLPVLQEQADARTESGRTLEKV